MSDTLELTFRFKTDGTQQLNAVAASIRGVSGAVSAGNGPITQFTTGLTNAGKASQESSEKMGLVVLKADLMAKGIVSVSVAIRDYLEDAAKYAARTEQLAVVSNNLARVNKISVEGVRQQAAAVKALGITTQESLNTVTRMTQARLDVGLA